MKRSYTGEMEWALNQAYSRNHDRNRQRGPQVAAALQYGLTVGIAKRSKEPLPPRPDLDKCV
jgi:hypothetical protein